MLEVPNKLKVEAKYSSARHGPHPLATSRKDGPAPCGSLIFIHLFQNFGSEAGESVVFHCVSNLNGFAANFTILDVDLAADRKVEHHRNFFPAIWALEEMLHWNGPLSGDPSPDI
jgi:hypothetical protein